VKNNKPTRTSITVFNQDIETDANKIYKIEFYAYHGTTLDAAASIVEERLFKPGETRLDHWLGLGTYFFREDYDQAEMWSNIKVRNNPS